MTRSETAPRSEGKVRRFLRYAKNHRIPLHPETRKIGIVCTLVGWACITFVQTSFPSPSIFFNCFFSFFVQFAAGTLCLFIAAMCLGKEFLKIKEFTNSGREDQSQYFAHLSATDRKSLIIWRSLIAIIGYALYSLATSKTQVIDNSSAFSADAFFYILLMRFVLKIKVSWHQKIAVGIVFLGVFCIISLDISNYSSGHPFLSLISALIGAAALAIIILLNTVIIQHEPPLRAAFYQCLIGLLTMGALISIWLVFSPDNLQLIDTNLLIHSVISGIFYATALIFFFSAFLYTEPLLIIIMGYSTFPFAIFFSWISGAPIDMNSLIGMILILSGGLASLYFQYKEDKQNTYANIAGYPIYLSTLKEKFRALKRDFLAGRLGMFEYLAQRHEFNKLIFEYSEDIATTEIESIEINNEGVIFTLYDFDIKMLSDKGCRSAPLEILNFGSYEKDESSLVFQMIKNDDIIFDVGANVGWYSIQFAKRFKTSIIHSFEPIPQTFSVLKKNVCMNNLQNVILHNTALGEIDGIKDFFYFSGGSAIASTINLLDHKKANKIECNSTTLDLMVTQLKIPRIDFFKCDVEGSELNVIKGGLDSIARFQPIIYIELFYGWCEKFGYMPSDVADLLSNYGYQCFKPFQGSLLKVSEIDKEKEFYNFFFLVSSKHAELINKFTQK